MQSKVNINAPTYNLHYVLQVWIMHFVQLQVRGALSGMWGQLVMKPANCWDYGNEQSDGQI